MSTNLNPKRPDWTIGFLGATLIVGEERVAVADAAASILLLQHGGGSYEMGSSVRNYLLVGVAQLQLL